MTDYAMKYDKKTMSDYVIYTMTGGSTGNMVSLAIFGAVITAIPIAALIAYCINQTPVMLAAMICGLIMDAIVVVIILMLIRMYSNKLLTAFTAYDGLVCAVSSERIIIVRSGVPQTVISWDDAADMYDGKRAFYILTKEGQLIILQKDNVLSGTTQETSEIIAEKLGERK